MGAARRGGQLRGKRDNAHHFRDAEIQQLHNSIGGDQDVARFQVAMHDRILVQIVDCLADLLEGLDASNEGEPLLVAILIQRQALHVLHHIVGHAIRRVPAVQNAGNIGMVERGQHLPLLFETLDDSSLTCSRSNSFSATFLRNAPSSRTAR